VSVKLELESRRALKAIYSPTHQIEVKRDGTHKAAVGFEANDTRPNSDFQLFYSQAADDVGISLLTHRPAGEEGYFLLLASPGVETKNTRVLPKDMHFVVDTSGSMAGAKLEQAKKALAFCVENLNEQDRFEVLRFATEVEPLFSDLRDATKENRSAAQKFIEGLKPIGGTAIDDALKKAVSLRPENGTRPFVVVFLTDGRPTVGTTDASQILANATKAKTGLTRIFCFGIGTDVNTHLLDKVAEETKAFTQYVLPEEDLEVKVSSFFTKIKEPVLASPTLKFPANVRVTKLYPSPLPDLFKGEQLVVVGRYTGKGDGAIQLEGNVGGETRQFAFDVKFGGDSAEHDFIPRLWATRRVGYLLDEIRLRGESKELKDEVTELARKYGVVTPYTAYLIQEDEVRRNVPLSMQTVPRGVRELDLVMQESRVRFGALGKESTGDGAVANARSFYSMKSADAPAAGLAAGNLESLRVAPAATPALQPQSGPRVALANTSTYVARPDSGAVADRLQQQSRAAGGKTFFQNGEKWIDADVQKHQSARRVRVPFGSQQYFDLLKQQPKTQAWLAQARHVEFVLGDTIYEVVD
jgi:Ca-activated chloride channel homolog